MVALGLCLFFGLICAVGVMVAHLAQQWYGFEGGSWFGSTVMEF